MVQCGNGRPLSGSLLSSGVPDTLQQVTFLVLVVQNVTSDFDEERIQHSLVPFVELLGHFLLGHTERQHEVIGFANQLHITVLDTVVDHLDKVAGTSFADPLAARISVGFGANCLKDEVIGQRMFSGAMIDLLTWKISLISGHASG